MRRLLPALAAAALLATLALAPTAAAETQEGTTSTGDVDTYGVAPHTTGLRACAVQAVILFWEIQLTLEDPAPGDRVLVSSQGQFAPHQAAVATYEDPTVTVSPTSGACLPPTEVAGLTVSGDLDYTITW